MREGFPIAMRHIVPAYRQETICDRFPIVLKHFGVPYRQETICEWFTIEMRHIGPAHRQETLTPVRFHVLSLSFSTVPGK